MFLETASVDHEGEIVARIQAWTGRPIRSPLRIHEDTTDYLAIRPSDLVRLGPRLFFVEGDAKEVRSGLTEEPKFWVKNVVDLADGARKVLKLVFHEEFTSRIAGVRLHHWRSSAKESEVLRRVRGDDRFMQGVTVHDGAGSPVQILDRIAGISLHEHMARLDRPPIRYYHEDLPGLLRRLIGCMEALQTLHRERLVHGDVCSDHVFVDGATGWFRWIDFDFDVDTPLYDVISMGTVLTAVVGKGPVFGSRPLPGAEGAVAERGDLLAAQPNRLANLRLVQPHIHPALNDLLVRFSEGGWAPFDDLGDLIGATRLAVRRAWAEDA